MTEELEEYEYYFANMAYSYCGLMLMLMNLYIERTERTAVEQTIVFLRVYYTRTVKLLLTVHPDVETQYLRVNQCYLAGKQLDSDPWNVMKSLKEFTISPGENNCCVTSMERALIYDLNQSFLIMMKDSNNSRPQFATFPIQDYAALAIKFLDKVCERCFAPGPTLEDKLNDLDPEFAFNIAKVAELFLPMLGLPTEKVQEECMPFWVFFRPLYGKCGNCGTETKLKCTKCGLARFCSVDCQKKVWKHHKKTCGIETVASMRAKLVQRPWNKILQKSE